MKSIALFLSTAAFLSIGSAHVVAMPSTPATVKLSKESVSLDMTITARSVQASPTQHLAARAAIPAAIPSGPSGQCLEKAYLNTLYDTNLKDWEKLFNNPARDNKVAACNFTTTSCYNLANDGQLDAEFIERFRPACRRRDFGLNNAQRFGRYPHDLTAIDLQFEDDLKDLCSKRETEPRETICEGAKRQWTDYVFSLEQVVYDEERARRNGSLPSTTATMTTVTVTAPPPGDATMIVGPATMTVGPASTIVANNAAATTAAADNDDDNNVGQ